MIYMVYSEECGACNNMLRKIDGLKIRKYFNLIPFQSLKPTAEVLNTNSYLALPYFFIIKDDQKKLLSRVLIMDVINKNSQKIKQNPVEKKTGFEKIVEDMQKGLFL